MCVTSGVLHGQIHQNVLTVVALLAHVNEQQLTNKLAFSLSVYQLWLLTQVSTGSLWVDNLLSSCSFYKASLWLVFLLPLPLWTIFTHVQWNSHSSVILNTTKCIVYLCPGFVKGAKARQAQIEVVPPGVQHSAGWCPHWDPSPLTLTLLPTRVSTKEGRCQAV